MFLSWNYLALYHIRELYTAHCLFFISDIFLLVDYELIAKSIKPINLNNHILKKYDFYILKEFSFTQWLSKYINFIEHNVPNILLISALSL